MLIHRRCFLGSTLGVLMGGRFTKLRASGLLAEPPMTELQGEEDLFAYLRRVRGGFDPALYKRLLGYANPFKEGDAIVGVAAENETGRQRARRLLSHTRLRDLDAHPLLEDGLHHLLRKNLDRAAAGESAAWTVGELARFLIKEEETPIQRIAPGLSSEVIACVVKLLSDEELKLVSSKLFNPLPGSRIGSKGYLSARIQPNSPTDHPDDIRWQVFSAFSYAVGDLLLGTNPVSSEAESVLKVERCLQDILQAFKLVELLPHCVLAHIDVQAEVERLHPGSTALWFQSIAGSDSANATFDLTNDKLLRHSAQRKGRFGLYFETGQGADFTNGHGHGFDMVIHESRKYGLARLLKSEVQRARKGPAWLHLNDVAGFIGPEVFRTQDQLVRCCLEDLVMGKLHGLTIGLDVCATLHMDIGLDDLDACLERIAPACPAYLMALPTKIDPMLGYLSTGYQDHVRLRERFGTKISDPMWAFFRELGVVSADGRPTSHFGDPNWVHLQYRRCKGDRRPEADIRAEGQAELKAVRARGVFVAQGFGKGPSELEPGLDREIRRITADAKQSLWTELSPAFLTTIPKALRLSTRSRNREDYILHPESGEKLSDEAWEGLAKLKQSRGERYDVQILVSDGLNALAITDPGHLLPCLETLREELGKAGFRPAPEPLILHSGRVRAGYRIGERLFGGLKGVQSIIHLIGERPGSGHHTFSLYLTAAKGSQWAKIGSIDHNLTKVVSGAATTALPPVQAARDAVRILKGMSVSVHPVRPDPEMNARNLVSPRAEREGPCAYSEDF